MKHGGNELYRRLSILYNAIVKYVHIPTCMKYNIIMPIHKGKNKPKDDPNSYRGISLASIINKIMEKIIFTRLKPWLEDHDFPPAFATHRTEWLQQCNMFIYGAGCYTAPC